MNTQGKRYTTKRKAVLKAYLLIICCSFIQVVSLILSEPFVTLLQNFNINIPVFILPTVIILLPFSSWFYVKDFIEESIEYESKEKIEKIREEYQQDINQIKEEYKRKAPEAIKERQELEFLAIWTDKEHLNHIDFNEMSENLRKELMKDRREFKEVYLDNFRKRYEARQDIVTNLNDFLLMRIARKAGDYSLNKKQNGHITKEENKIYKNIYAILKAWLICSIKFDCDMPTRSLHRIIKNSKYELDALNYTRDNILLDDKIKEIFTNDMSREIIKDYINRFVEKINTHANSSDTTKEVQYH
ncbi:hypothetical protein NIES267_22160 [Calothrix parasitica NIES-267]|uniref:Uncharacterized protein n=1 Tax=Calothrix parasitica NIES-267 TaxID=1973488 RepID=A0A1Z4LNC9_9CYAN|nr:hypothetical protein NIES267_22160 [Calothrix parasitica NIES-267]